MTTVVVASLGTTRLWFPEPGQDTESTGHAVEIDSAVPLGSGGSPAHRGAGIERDRDETIVGRKSRAKAARRAELARAPDQLPTRAPDPPRPRWMSDASSPAPPRPADTSAAPTAAPPTGAAAPGEHLRFLLARHRAGEREIEEEVRRLINGGKSWTFVGEVLGLSRQGARQRYRRFLGAR